MKKNLKNLFRIIVIILCSVAVGYLAFAIYRYQRNQTYTGPESERAVSWLIDDYAEAYCKKNNMELIHIGGFTDATKNIWFGMWLRSFSNQTLEDARVQVRALVKDFLHTLENDECAQFCLQETQNSIFYRKTPNVAILDLLGVKIAYWDQNVNRPLPPYLAEITFYDHKFRYYQADPKTQALVLCFEEAFTNPNNK